MPGGMCVSVCVCLFVCCCRAPFPSHHQPKPLPTKKKSSHLLKGYQSVRKLNEIEKKNLNTLCRGSALRYLLTRSYDYLNTPKQAIIKIKDPKEYIDKLNYHRNLSSFEDYS